MTQDEEHDSKGWFSGLPEALGIIGLIAFYPLFLLFIGSAAVPIMEYLSPEVEFPVLSKGTRIKFALFTMVALFFLASIPFSLVMFGFLKHKRFIRGFLTIQFCITLLALAYLAWIFVSFWGGGQVPGNP